MSELSGLHYQLRPYAENLVQIGRANGPVRVTSVLRSYQTQARLYRAYLAGRSAYPAAPPGTSYHEYGRAFDIEGPSWLISALGRLWESWGGTWGAKFGDPIHFQA